MAHIHLSFQRVFLICLVGLINITQLWSIDPDISQQIKMHQEWVETHVPLPDTLSQENLLIEATKAIVTPCYEERYINIIRYAGEQYGLKDLAEFADSKSQKAIDKDNAMARMCLKLLWEKSKEINGPSSYATTQIGMYLALTSIEEEEETKWVKIFYTAAKELYTTHPSPQNEELWLFAQFLNIDDGTLQLYENPLTYEKHWLLIADIIRFYARTHIISEIRSQIYGHISGYFSQCYLYPDYCAYINQTFYDKNDSILIGQIPLSYLTEQDGDEKIADHQDFQKASITILAQCTHAYHPEVINTKMGIYYQDPSFATNEEIGMLIDYSKEYFGETSLEHVTSKRTLTTKLLMEEHKTDGINNDDLLFTLKNYYSETSIPFITVVNKEMSMYVFAGQNNRALLLSDLLHAITKEKYQHDIIHQLAFRYTDWYFQRTGAPRYETAFDDLVQEFMDHCEQHLNFETIGVGKQLVETAKTMFNDKKTALRLQHKVLLLLNKMINKTHPLFVFEYIEYGRMVASTYPSEATTLEGEDDAEALYSDIIACAQTCSTVQTAFTATGVYYIMQGNPARARTYFIQAVETIEKESANKQLSQVEKDANRYYLASQYAYILSTYGQEGTASDSIDYYDEKLLHEFADGIDFQPGFSSHIHEAVVSCYMRHNQIKEAEQLLTKCLEYYDKNPNQAADGFYTKIIQALVQIYGNAYSDMDKCLLLAERIERDIDKIKDFGNYEAYIDQLRILYELVEFKNPFDFFMLNKYYGLLEEAIGKYVQASKNNETLVINYGVYLATKKIAFAAREPSYRAMAIALSSEKEFDEKIWLPLKKDIVENLIPFLLKRREDLIQIYPSIYRQTPNYQQILMNLAVANQRCTDDLNLAEQYYIQLTQCNEQQWLPLLGDFYLETGNTEKAVETYAHIEKMLEDKDDENLQDLFANMRGEMYGRIGMAYYQASEYDKAIKPAQIYYAASQKQIEKNFDLYTQNEREAFLMKNGAGGTLLEWLLPHKPEELSPVVYNIMLQEKGLLLRASERIHTSILSSNNDTLIHALDSLHILRQQLQIMENNTQESQEQFRMLRDQHDKLERFIVRASEPFRKKGDDIPSWEQVRDHLKEGEACIEFVITDSATLALVLTPHAEAPQCVPLMKIEEMEDVLEKITNTPKNRLIQDVYEKNTAHLYNRIWQPLENKLEGIHTVYYSPTGFLNSIAFAAIPLPDGQFLMDKYNLHQLTTTGRLAYRESAQNNTVPQSANVYGSIFYSQKQKNEKGSLIADMRKNERMAEKTLRAQNQKRGAILNEDKYPFLPFTLTECDAITKTLTDNQITVKEEIGERPTEREIRSLDGQSPDILHISTHGFFFNNIMKAKQVPYFRRFNELNAMLCTGLVLANGEESWQNPIAELKEDNILSSIEIASLDWSNTRLAVLSACETGLGSFESEGVFGLQRGLKQAGVKAICASLWSVNDLSTSQLMQSFYHLWIAQYHGTNMQQAMREAMLEQRKKTPSPYYWAPFVLYDADF